MMVAPATAGPHAEAHPVSRETLAVVPSFRAVYDDYFDFVWTSTRRLLGEVGPLKREVFVLAELEEMTTPEIAEAVGIPLNTAYSRLRVARQEFSEALARHDAQQKERR
jgi:DNA-directed RNA polymerase specialized sigma24 family protein